jgi:hypothetical protein
MAKATPTTSKTKKKKKKKKKNKASIENTIPMSDFMNSPEN